MSRRAKPAVSPVPGTHTGRSLQAETWCASSQSAGTQVSRASEFTAAPTPASISFMLKVRDGPVALNTPKARASAMRMVHSARSRASMNCTGSLPSPGASTSPPLPSRTGQ